MAWSFSSDKPIYLQVSERILKKIISGTYLPGQQIPSVRQLAMETAVNPNTVQRALSALEEDGLLVTQGTLGRFVTNDPEVIEASRRKHARTLVQSFLKDAEQMSLSKQQLIEMLEEEFNEHTEM